MGKTIALYGGSFKPPHKGHFEVITNTLNKHPEIDEFIIFVGGGVRDGISQAESLLIWDIYKKFLPLKVRIEPASQPIGAIYRYVKEHKEDKILWVIGAREGKEEDFKDLAQRTKKSPDYPNIEILPVISSNANNSATKTREALKQSKEQFFKYVPDKLNLVDKEEVYNILTPVVKEQESLIDQLDISEWVNSLAQNNIDEAKQVGPLYHFTDFYSFRDIINQNKLGEPRKNVKHDLDKRVSGDDAALRGDYEKSDKIRAAKYSGPEKDTWSISTTRNKNLYKHKPSIGGTKVRICLDGNKLSERFKIIPYRYFYEKSYDRTNPTDLKYDENEEIIICPSEGITGLDKYVTSYDIMLDQLTGRMIVNEISLLAELSTKSKVRFLYNEKTVDLQQWIKQLASGLPHMPELMDNFTNWKQQLAEEEIIHEYKNHDELNPIIWNGDQMKPKLRIALEKIGDKFYDGLGITAPLEDIWLIGSSANYNWTSASDIDLHLIIDFDKLENKDIFKKYFDTKKIEFNTKYQLKYKGHPVEVYVQDLNEPNAAQGIFSIKNNIWVKVPTKESIEVPDNEINMKAQPLMDQIDSIINGDASLDDVSKLKEKIRQFRTAGLETGGEYSVENLAFKKLRNNGYLEKLNDYQKEKTIDSFELDSIQEGKSYHEKLVDMAKRKDPDALTPLGKTYLNSINAFSREIIDNIAESKNIGPLYHFTSLDSLKNILNDNIIKGSYDGRNYRVSLTRDKNLGHKPNVYINSNKMRIVLDGNKLSEKYRIKPFNDANWSLKGDENMSQSKKGSWEDSFEAEESIEGNITNIKDYIISLDIINEPEYKEDRAILIDLIEQGYPIRLAWPNAPDAKDIIDPNYTEKSAVNEAKQVGTVYHITNLQSLFNISKSNLLKAGRNEDETDGPKYVSTTRDKNFLLSRLRMQKQDFLSGNQVILVLDGNKLSNKYKSKPYDDAFIKGEPDYGDEQEERWYGPKIDQYGGIKNIKEYITEIIISPFLNKWLDWVINFVTKSGHNKIESWLLSAFDRHTEEVEDIFNQETQPLFIKKKLYDLLEKIIAKHFPNIPITYQTSLKEEIISYSRLREIHDDFINKIKNNIKQVTKYALDNELYSKQYPLPKVKFITNDIKNGNDPLGKTAYYNPEDKSITLFTLNRHPKDITRSFCHEMEHWIQDIENRLHDITTDDVNEDDKLKELEREAYEKGNLLLRSWENSLKGNTLQEAKQVGTLYHYTRYNLFGNKGNGTTNPTGTLGSRGNGILGRNKLTASGRPEGHAISFTRDKNFHKISSRSVPTQVRIQINGDKLSEYFKLQPYQDTQYSDKSPKGHQTYIFSIDNKPFEAEEVIKKDESFSINNLDSYVHSYDIFLDKILKTDYYDQDVIESLILNSKEPKVKFYFKDKLVDLKDILKLYWEKYWDNNPEIKFGDHDEDNKALIQYINESLSYNNWQVPDLTTLKREYEVEHELKGNNFFNSEEEFLEAVKNGKIESLTKDQDRKIAYRSGTKSYDELLSLIKGYRSYPKYRNEKTLRNLYDRFKGNDSMDLPIVIDLNAGKRRILAGNTRLDVAFQLGITPKILIIKATND